MGARSLEPPEPLEPKRIELWVDLVRHRVKLLATAERHFAWTAIVRAGFAWLVPARAAQRVKRLA